ncbi:hypothetical protein KSF_048490 [Reticulibacter mediterranei]|uniref:Uncharacterized protein n=2 Tax=Reticulibacter mediterranei TaxID=2778369 RepID=A0A8J3IRA2_9CHLR|nr:hypothetical protein KSF_048490 [Reticulibacter mediterranei]
MENKTAQSGGHPPGAVPNKEAKQRKAERGEGRKQTLASLLAGSIFCVMLNTVGMLVYFSSLEAAWWIRGLVAVILLGELVLYFLWGMVVEGRISKQTLLMALCRPVRRIALFLIHVTAPYVQEEGLLLVVLDLSVPSSDTQSPASEVQ